MKKMGYYFPHRFFRMQLRSTQVQLDSFCSPRLFVFAFGHNFGIFGERLLSVGGWEASGARTMFTDSHVHCVKWPQRESMRLHAIIGKIAHTIAGAFTNSRAVRKVSPMHTHTKKNASKRKTCQCK